MTHARYALLLFVALSSLAPACAELPDISRGTCGNGVVDSGEDCDNFFSKGTICGAPGVAGECRFQCHKQGDASECPAGYGCGTDLICRAPKDTFAATDQLTELGGRTLASADFDGDGRRDLLSLGQADLTNLASARIVYFDGDARVAQQTILPSLVRSPSARDLDGDGADDLVASVDLFRGVQVFRGSRDRDLSNVAYPSFNLPRGSRMRVFATDVLSGDDYSGDEVILVGTYTLPGSQSLTAIHADTDDPGALLESVGTDSLRAIAVLPAPIEDLAAVGTGTIRTCVSPLDQTCACPWLYYTYKGSTDLSLLQLCRKTANGTLDWNRVDKQGKKSVVPAVDIKLPMAVGRVFITDANGDGSPDVVASAKGTAFIAYGDGKGAFFGTPQLGSPGQVEALKLPNSLDPGEQDLAAEILAVGHLDRDATADFVTSRGIFVRGSDGACPGQPGSKSCTGICPQTEKACAVVPNFGALWTNAVIADLNGNGAPDVLVGAETNSGLTFYNGSGVGVFNQANIPTDAPVRHFVVGDYDGDYVDDVALVEIGNHDPALGPTGDTVSIVFGRTSVPERPVEVAKFDRVVELEGGFLPNGFQFDFAHELAAVSTSEDGSVSSIAILFGSADRRPLAPLTLRKFGPNPKDSIDQGAVATLVLDLDGDGKRDVAALGVTFPGKGSDEKEFREPRWWSLPNAGGTDLSIGSVSPPLMINPFLVGFGVLAVGGDLDGDGRDEVVLAATRISALAKTEISISGTPLDAGALAPRSGGTLDRYTPAKGALSLVDLDGDGALDLVLLTRALTSEDQLTKPADEVSVLWGQAGGFDYASPTIVAMPKGLVYATGARRTASGLALVVVGDAGVYFPKRTGRQLTFGEPAFAGGDGGAVADVNGDGIDDIAVLSNGTLRIHVGQAVLP